MRVCGKGPLAVVIVISSQARKSFGRSVNGSLNIGVTVCCRHKACLKGRWSEVNAAFKHAMEKLAEALGITVDHLFVPGDLGLLSEESTKHSARMVGGEGNPALSAAPCIPFTSSCVWRKGVS